MSIEKTETQAQRPTRAEINLDHLLHNFRVMQEAVGPDVAIMPAVKAGAYGHGAARCAQALEEAGAPWFGVALPESGLKLRRAGISRPILCLGGFWDGQEELVVEHGLTPVMFRLDLLERLNDAARKAKVVFDYHLKVDTGLGRLGVPHHEFESFLDDASAFSNLRMDGFLTHFASADDQKSIEFTERQMNLFEEALQKARRCGFAPRWIHEANSAATHAYPRARGNFVRLGGALYGIWRDTTRSDIAPLDWRPVLSLKTEIMMVKTVSAGTSLGYGRTFYTERESRIATLPIGYADGLRRDLSNKGRMLVRGQFAPVVGRVSMDLTLLDVTEVAGATVGDEVVIIGAQGNHEIAVEEIAAGLGTIAYEITSGISDRVPRIYQTSQGIL